MSDRIIMIRVKNAMSTLSESCIKAAHAFERLGDILQWMDFTSEMNAVSRLAEKKVPLKQIQLLYPDWIAFEELQNG